MRRMVVFGTVALLAGSVIAGESGPADEIKNAAKKLDEKGNYSWKSTVESAGGGQFRRGPTEGKTEKDGFTTLSMTFGDNTLEAVLKGDKGAIKGPDGWRSLAEAAEDTGQQNPGRFIAVMLRTYRTPAAEAENLAAKTVDLKKLVDLYFGELTEEGAKELLTFRRGGNAPAPTGAKGSVKFWVKDGVLTKYEFRVQGTVTFNNNDVNVDRTTTVEIKDVGSTNVEVPEEAKKKSS